MIKDHFSSQDVSSFYDQHAIKFLTDYLFGNLRVRVQLRFFEQGISRKSRRIALIGSGSGEGARTVVSRFAPYAEMVAADISPRCIELGRKLFPHSRITYVLADLTEKPLSGSFDTILLPDVYEHIPRELRANFHRNIRQMLSENGRILITAPTPAHQNCLRKKGEGLQIVDEDVTLQDMLKFALDLGGTLTFYALVSVGGGCNPYFHAAIEKQDTSIRLETENDLVEIRKALPRVCWPKFIANNLDRMRKAAVSFHILRALGWKILRHTFSMRGKRPVIHPRPDRVEII